jgi:ubiquinol oxidase
MIPELDNAEHELLSKKLDDEETLSTYRLECDNCEVSTTARVLGNFLVFLGNFFYGKKPSYEKFKAIEVIARIPYQSWEVASYVFLSAFHGNEKKAIELAKTSAFSRMAQDNETMHVVVISHIVQREHGASFIMHTFIPVIFSLFYFWAIFILYFISPRRALELNYLFEDHAFHQYDQFLKEQGEVLRHKPITSEFLDFYGRHVRNEYELFLSIRNDELVHRNSSMHHARLLKAKAEQRQTQ